MCYNERLWILNRATKAGVSAVTLMSIGSPPLSTTMPQSNTCIPGSGPNRLEPIPHTMAKSAIHDPMVGVRIQTRIRFLRKNTGTMRQMSVGGKIDLRVRVRLALAPVFPDSAL